MLTKILLLTISAGSMLLLGAEDGRVIRLTPRAEDANSMRACGADLEAVKTQNGFTRRVVVKDGQMATGMQFCRNGKAVVSRSQYRITVPPSEEIDAWVNADGSRGVIEGCINITNFIPPIAPPPAQPTPVFTPLVQPQVPDYHLPAWTPVRLPQAPEQPAQPPECAKCVAIVSSYPLAELKPKSKPIEVWAEIQGGNVVDGVWSFNGQEVGRGLRITLEPKKLYKLVHGKAGTYFLSFSGRAEDGTVITCGLKGTPMQLIKKGRMWLWKLPVLNCIYAYTKGIKDWSTWGTIEKLGVCPAEAFAAWYFWPVSYSKSYEICPDCLFPWGK